MMNLSMKKADGIKALLVTVLLLAMFGFVASIPFANDSVARQLAQLIRETDLPVSTHYIESFSASGKLAGNGNGMQYIGGILIKSELPLEEIQAYYSNFSDNEWEYIVTRQTGKRVYAVEHETITLKTDIDADDYYIVYSWGDSDSIFKELDIRGH